MLCEECRSAITDALASGSMSSRLQAHLQSCEACGVAFAGEKALFTAMEVALGDTANADVPVSLVPTVRAAIAGEAAPSPRLRVVWSLAPTLVAVSLILIVFSPRILRHSHSSNVSVVEVTPDRRDRVSMKADSTAAVPRLSASVRQRHATQRAIPRVARGPRVIVPADSEAAVLRYAAFLRRRADLAKSLAAAQAQTPAQIKPLEIAEIRSEPLSIDPLATGSATGRATGRGDESVGPGGTTR